MKTVILINGKAQSGKDTFAELLVPLLCENNKRAIILPNAFGVKEIASNVYGWNRLKDERGRGLLIDVTNTGYSYDPMFWERYAHRHLSQLEKTMGEFDYVIVPDFRYEVTERYYIALGCNVYTINVQRPDHLDNEMGKHANDKSEQPLNTLFNSHVTNNKDLGFLEKQAQFVAHAIKQRGM